MKTPVRTAEFSELQAKVGQSLGVSDWTLVSQSTIDGFADLTGDHQPIHVDPVEASKTEFGGTIAHGFFVLSLLGNFCYQIVPRISGAGVSLNYGFNRVRFLSPVKCGSRVRGRFTLASIDARGNGDILITLDVTVEVEGQDRPALIAQWLMLLVPDRKTDG